MMFDEKNRPWVPKIGSEWKGIKSWVDTLVVKYVSPSETLEELIYDMLSCDGGEITHKFVRHMIWCLYVFDQKQQNYGPENIAKLGEAGVMSRVELDKFSRLKTLSKNP